VPIFRSRKPTPTSSRPRPRNDAERLAARWYRRRGYRVLAGNVWLAGAELDLVLRRGRTIVFCEVKSKSGDGFGDPLEMVDGVKIARLRRAALAWLALAPADAGTDVRFDVVAVRAGRIEHLPNAF
jgi:putative endonuclease